MMRICHDGQTIPEVQEVVQETDLVRRPSKGKPQVSDSPPESYLCYNCRKPGHWKSPCPYPKVEKYGERERNEKKKKAMVAAESDESSSSSSDEEALVCMERRAEKSNHEDRWTISEDDTLVLMAKDDAEQEVTSQTFCSSSYESVPTSESLFDKFKKMMKDFEEINLKHSSLTEENRLLSEENLKLTEGWKSQLDEITQLKTENKSLSEKVKSLNKELRILKSKEAVDKLLEATKQKGHEGLGFVPSSSKRKGRTTFIPPKPTAKPNKQKGKEKEKPTEVPKKDKDEEINEGDIMKPTEFIPFGSLPLKTSRRNPDSDGVEPTENHGQPSIIPDHSNDDNFGKGEHQVPTPMDKLTTEDKKKLSLNAKALNVLFCALGQDEFARVSSCKSAKEAWKLLEATHEGDKDTKATKIALGTSEYENFKMKAGESVQDMNKRFNLIVNNLSGFKAYADPHIIAGRTLKQDDIPVPVLELIQEQGWSFFLQLQAPVYPDLVHHFYSSMKYYPEDPSITAVVAGKTFGFNTQNLSEWFILLKILKENVIPVLNKDKQVGVYEYTLLYWLLTHKKINLPSIILKHMYECSGRQNKPYGMLLTHIFAKREILEVRPSRVRYLDVECLGYCSLVKIGEAYYMKKEFQNLDEATRAEYGPRRSLSSVPSTSRAPRAKAAENANMDVPVRAPRVKRSKSASHASSASLLHRHSQMASTSKNPFKKFKKFILKTVVAPMKKIQESLDDLSGRMKKMEDRENRQKQNEDRASRRRAKY
ncbi:unnamed protein product [Cuscuta campestris]|uniref:CCHC-type domain-containing protein n=1 Tax=Cuscuta campestris TaxID=132261 RepID=A0A484LXS7_9ASTE|nr:unnamed protein product [Cuscuta campestris]